MNLMQVAYSIYNYLFNESARLEKAIELYKRNTI